MSMPDAPDPSGDVKIRWIKPEGIRSYGADEVRDEERRKPSAERADVFAIDLETADIESALGWAESYRAGQDPLDPPVCLVVCGRAIEPKEQARFALAGIQAIDVYREDLGLHGSSDIRLANLVRSAVMTHSLVVPNPGGSAPGPSSGDWRLYTTQPSHVPASALSGLFEELARDDRPWWERES